VTFTSTLSPAIVNELRFGHRRNKQFQYASFDRPDEIGRQALATLPVSNGIPFLPKTVLFPENIIAAGGSGSTRGQASPLYPLGNNVSWTRGRHVFKGGFDTRFTNSDAFTTGYIAPIMTFGAGGAAVTGIDSVAIPGLTANNAVTARNLLIDLSGSLQQI